MLVEKVLQIIGWVQHHFCGNWHTPKVFWLSDLIGQNCDYHASNSRNQRHYVWGCLSVPFLWTRYLRNPLRGFLQIWHKHPLGLIRNWWSEVKITVSAQNTFLTITQPFIWWLRPKKKKSLITCWRSKVNFVVTSSFCEKMFWPLFKTCGDIQPQDGDSSPIIIVPRMSVYFWIWLTVQLLSFHCHNMLSVCDNSE